MRKARLLITGILLAACGGQEESSSNNLSISSSNNSSNANSESRYDHDPRTYVIDPTATAGCRAPDEPGCRTCAVQGPESCSFRSSDVDDWRVEYPGTIPNYNGSMSSLDGGEAPEVCPAEIPACAQCSRQAEELYLRTWVVDPECDCDIVEGDTSLDRCGPLSGRDAPRCVCYCGSLGALMDTCPPA